jgi:peptidoglycan/LPS O-acetylase OafA/YrhL
MGTTHNPRLQSLRGIAALLVLVGHAGLLVAYQIDHPLLTILCRQQNSAVLFFYVLSGYVLGESLRRSFDAAQPLTSLGAFTIKRLARLMPVYWAAVALGALTILALDRPPIAGLHSWYSGNFGGGAAVLTGKVWWRNLTGWTPSMNGALWSVQIELWIIPLLPIVVAVSRRLPLQADLLIVGVLGAISHWLMFGPTSGTPLNVVPYLYFFWIGVALPKLMTRWPLVFSSGPLFGFLIALDLLVHMTYTSWGLSWPGRLLIDGPVSALIIGFVLARPDAPFARFLTVRPLTWLGDVSYSFYAYGTCILMIVGVVIVNAVPPSWLTTGPGALFVMFTAAIGALIVTLPLAYLSYRYIELPGTEWGRRLATAVSRRSVPDAVPAGGQIRLS